MQKIKLEGDIGFEITLAEIMGIVKANEGQEIEFIVSTYGGYVDEAWRIYNYLATQNNISVTFDGICASAGTFAFLSIPKEKRKATAGTNFAIHLPYNSYFFSDLNAEELETEADRLNVVTEEITQVYEKELNMSREDINLLLSPDSWFSEQSALGFEFISEVVEKTAEEVEAQLEMFVFDKVKSSNRICALVKKDINKNKNNMSEKLEKEMKEQRTMLESFIGEVKNFFKPKNLVIQTKEGVDIEVGELKVGVTTSTPDGTYTATIDDVEKKIVIKDGKIESIEVVEKANEEVENLKKENETLKEELAQAKADGETVDSVAKKVIETLKEENTALNLKVEGIKALESKVQDFLKKEVPAQPKNEVERRRELKKKLNKN